MSTEREAAIINAASTRAMIRAMGMQAENYQRSLAQEAPAYNEQAFLDVIEHEGIGHNSVISMLNFR